MDYYFFFFFEINILSYFVFYVWFFIYFFIECDYVGKGVVVGVG